MSKYKKMTVISFIIILVGLWQSGCSSPSQPSQAVLQKAIQDEINGLNKIEEDVNKGDFKSAIQVYDGIHDEFHTTIFDPVKAKLGDAYGDSLHGKMDILSVKIINQHKSVVNKVIQLNRDSMYTVAKDMGITLNK